MTVLVGNSTLGANADSFASGELDLWPFTAAASGVLAKLWCNPGAAPGAGMTSVDLCIYDGAGVDPVNRLGFGTFAGSNPSGLFSVDVAALPSIVSGTKYWLGINPHGGIFNDLERTVETYYANTGANASPPVTAPARSATGSGGLAIWGEDAPPVVYKTRRSPLHKMRVRSH